MDLPDLDEKDIAAIKDALEIAVAHHRNDVEINSAQGNPALETLIANAERDAEQAGRTLMKFSFLVARGEIAPA